MNPYGDPNSVRGRAQVPGPAEAAGPDDEMYPPHRAGTTGRASVGKASVRPGGSGAVGAARVGRASVGARVGGNDEGVRGTAGAPTGRATVGRAVVQPISPAGPGAAGPELGAPAGRRPSTPAAAKRAKRRKRANWLMASMAVLVILAGSGLMAFTWFYDEVPAYDPSEREPTTLLYADGKTQLAKLGNENRTIVPADKISQTVKQAVMAAEDKNFLEHGGIDLKGIARAAWNNFSGGDTQGASTITQQYARHAAELNDISYNRKIREAILARKMEEDLGKPVILANYLNAIYYGRGAYGIEAAAQAYFKKSVTAPPGSKNALTVSEAAVLASVIKQPEPDKLTGHNGYDPHVNPAAAQERWAYTLNNMVEKQWITPAERAAAKYPKVQKYNPKACAVGCGINRPTGFVIDYVRDEMEAMGLSFDKGGYRITTTINPKAQAAAESVARRASVDSPMNKLPKNYMASLVAVDPNNGRVLAYYGGENGTGTDFAGFNTEKDGRKTGGHPPGSTFKVYTLAAGLQQDVAFETRWDSTKKDGRKVISNAQRENLTCPKTSCPLKEATLQSYNFPFYWIAKGVGPSKVVAAAKEAGIRSIWNNEDKYFDLNQTDPEDVDGMSPEVGFGQFKVTVLDHANGTATLAARGKYNKAHFVKTVEMKDPVSGKWVKKNGEQLKPKQVFDAEKMDNLNGVLQEIPGSSGKALRNRPAIGKTGTWELNNVDKRKNGDAWMIGATPQVAAAVWVGTTGNRKAITERNGSPMFGGGTPATIWKQFMDKVHEDLELPVEQFPERKITGDPNNQLANGTPAPVEIPDDDSNQNGNPFCNVQNPNPILCPNGQGNGGNDNQGNGNGNGNGNGDQNDNDNDNGNGNQPDTPFDRNGRVFNTPPPE